MARGDCQREFAEAAAEDGIELTGQSFGWLCQQGHLALPDEASSARDTLSQIYAELKGDPDELAGAPTTGLSGDFVHEATGTLIEIDEHQHFTSARMATLRLYPDDAQLGFDVEHYKALCNGGNAKRTKPSPTRTRTALVSVADSGSAPTTTRYATSPPPRWGILL